MVKNTLNEQGLLLISLADLSGESFFIPAYQRGYRWTKLQVTDLLEDILEFQGKKKSDGEFYCLQPIVVTRKDNAWLVIDGQQRLTTIYIMLKYLGQLQDIAFPSFKLFSILYETREKEHNNSRQFLENITEITQPNTDNPDFYYMSNAYLTIKEWLEKINRLDFLQTLLKTDYTDKNSIDRANNIRFIWYNAGVQDEQSSKQIFAKINMGKIPLTNAELIKALCFINDGTSSLEKEKRQNKIAYEWNAIEDALQSDDFWFFIQNNSSLEKSNRIEFIFDLVAKNENSKTEHASTSLDTYHTFYVFNSLIKNANKNIGDLWEETKKYFRIFSEWFSDSEYYHLIGYLVNIGIPINDILLLSVHEKNKNSFKTKIKEKIKNNLQITEENLKELNYSDDKDKIKKILLLFNVLSTWQSGYQHFPFQKYIEEKWSLEHIHAQNSEEIKTNTQRQLLLTEQQAYYKNKDSNISKKIETILKEKEIDGTEFNELQEKIFSQFSDSKDNEEMHALSNLALLSLGSNSAVSNNIFPIKRDKIIELDSQGKFIPLCTKNVFLKYYSKDAEQNVMWTKVDRESYFNEIKNTLCNYMGEQKNGD